MVHSKTRGIAINRRDQRLGEVFRNRARERKRDFHEEGQKQTAGSTLL